jgi:hypothetical protein
VPTDRVPWLSPEIAAVQAYHRARVEALYRGETPAEVIAIVGKTFGRSHGLAGRAEIDMIADPDSWLADVFAQMADYAPTFADPVTFRPIIVELDPLGVHFVDAVLGARTGLVGGQYWSEQLPIDLDDLRMPDLRASPVFQAALRLGEKAVALARRGDGCIFVATPVLSCAINIAINLFGERFLEALIDRPEAARRCLRVINGTIIGCTRTIQSAIPADIRRNSVAENRFAPPGVGQIDGCATQLVSKRAYDDYFAALDAEVLGLSPLGGLMHICGAHTQHLATWAAMRELKAVQLNDRATEDLPAYFACLRPDQLLYVAPTTDMPLGRVLEITGGRRLVLQQALEAPIPTPD